MLRGGLGAPKITIQEEDNEQRNKGARGVKEGIPDGRATRGDKDLVELVGERVDRGNRPSEHAPGPVEALARAANSAINEQEENEVFDEVPDLAEDVMDVVDPIVGHRRKKPM